MVYRFSKNVVVLFLLIHPHPQCEPAASPATQFSGSGRGRRHARPSFLPTTRSTDLPERREERRNISENDFEIEEHWSICPILLTHLSLRPLTVSIHVFCGYSWLWHLFLHLLGSRGRCGSRYTSCCRWGSPSPRVLWDELGFASEGISVLGRRCCVPTAQRDQQGWCILPSNPLISQERRLQASCVWVKVSLK